jgi:hypothetical protein
MLSANGLAHPPPETVVSGSSCSSSSLQHKQRLSSSAWFQNFLNFFKHRTELRYGVTHRNCANTMKITKFKLHQLYSQTEQAIGHTSLAGEHLLPFQCFNFIYTQTNYADLIPFIPIQNMTYVYSIIWRYLHHWRISVPALPLSPSHNTVITQPVSSWSIKSLAFYICDIIIH